MFSVNKSNEKVDVSGLTISIASSTSETPSGSKARGKSKAKADGRELISDSHLRLKPGVHYGLLGRNGSGKSSKEQDHSPRVWFTADGSFHYLALLRAMADKIIPGIPYNTRISILQQTNSLNEGENHTEGDQDGTVLAFVLNSDQVRNRTVQKANRESRF